MKHVRKISASPAKAWWFGWFSAVGELKSAAPGTLSAKAQYVDDLFNHGISLGTWDPRDVRPQ